MRREFQTKRMSKDENPETFVIDMEGLRIRKSDAHIFMNDQDFYLQIIGNLLKEYDIEVHEFETILDERKLDMTTGFINKKRRDMTN